MTMRLGIEGYLERPQFRLDLSLDLDLTKPLRRNHTRAMTP